MKADDFLAARRDRARKLMRARGLDAMLVSHPANRYYLSGFELHDPQPGESAGFLILASGGRDMLATDGRYLEAAARIWPREQIFIYRDAPSGIGSLLGRMALVAGIEGKSLSLSFVRRMRAAPGAPSLAMADGLVEKLRMIKEDREIEALKKSFALNHKMLAWLEKELSGELGALSEKEVAWEIEKFFRRNGAQELAFASIVASGQNAALPHAVPGGGAISLNAPILVDAGCRLDDYCSDQTRTWWRGNQPSEEFARTMALVREAQEAALRIMRPGLPCAEAYAAALEIFSRAGVAKAFNHGLGHGVGLETHEAPSLSPKSGDKLEKGMVVTVEPGLYYPHWGGVRWENTVLIGDEGAIIL